MYPRLHLHSTHLRHLVALALPAEPLVVVRISMCAYVDGLPVHIVACAFAYVEHAQLVRLVGRHPFLGLGHPMATGAHSLMEGYGLAGAQKLLQLRLVVGHGRRLVDLKNTQREHSVWAERGSMVNDK